VRAEIIAKLLEALDFVTFREVALRLVQERGYELVADSDGWSDGGSDLRVYSRHAPQPVRYEAEFVPVSDELEMSSGLRAAKMDQQDIAAFVLTHNLTSWFLKHLGADTSENPSPPKTAAEAARDAYMLFSDDSGRFREGIVEHALKTVLEKIIGTAISRSAYCSRSCGARNNSRRHFGAGELNGRPSLG
jgi:hypothetical protein